MTQKKRPESSRSWLAGSRTEYYVGQHLDKGAADILQEHPGCVVVYTSDKSRYQSVPNPEKPGRYMWECIREGTDGYDIVGGKLIVHSLGPPHVCRIGHI